MSEITKAIQQICEDKGIPYESVIETIESALASAYRKDFGTKLQNIKVEFDPETAASRVFDVKTVVSDELYLEAQKAAEERKRRLEAGEKLEKEAEEKTKPAETEPKTDKETAEVKEGEETEELKFNPKTHIPLSEAKKLKKDARLEDVLRIELEIPAAYGRMAAQAAKQVIIQKLRETEREVLFNEFKAKEHSIVTGVVGRREGRIILLDVGRSTAVLRPEDQISKEPYRTGERMKVYISSVTLTTRGPEILVSRTHPDIVKKLFEMEIPEVGSGAVVIQAIAREAGLRSKVAVYTKEKNIDPIGSCIGQRGARIQTIINELGGERIDIIEYDEEPIKFISNALSPAKVLSVVIDPKTKTAAAHVAPDQYSLSIGKEGQNVRLAAKLTDWKINIVQEEPSKTKKQAVEKGKEEKEEKGEKEETEKGKAVKKQEKEAKKAVPEEKKKKTKKKTEEKGKEKEEGGKPGENKPEEEK